MALYRRTSVSPGNDVRHYPGPILHLKRTMGSGSGAGVTRLGLRTNIAVIAAPAFEETTMTVEFASLSRNHMLYSSIQGQKTMTLTTEMKPVHPGGFIRRSVLPDGLSVTAAAAAKALSVGRPALSNLLNGNASLSPEMTLRIEKAFGIKMDTLLRMQARFDAYQMRELEAHVRVQRFAGA